MHVFIGVQQTFKPCPKLPSNLPLVFTSDALAAVPSAKRLYCYRDDGVWNRSASLDELMPHLPTAPFPKIASRFRGADCGGPTMSPNIGVAQYYAS